MAWALNGKVISSAYGKRMTRSLCYCLPGNICFCLCVCSQYKATHKRRAWLAAKELCETQMHRQKNCTPVQSLLHVSTMLCQQLCSEIRFPLGYYQLSSNNQTEELREISVFLCCFTSFHVPHFPPRWSNTSQSLESLLYCLQIQSN